VFSVPESGFRSQRASVKITMAQTKPAVSNRKKPVSAPKARPAAPPVPSPTFQQYQAAVHLVQQGKYDKALAALEKLLPSAPPQIAERCRMYAITCRRQLEHAALSFASPEERCDYAVAQLNQGLYEEAREHFNAIIAGHAQADYAFYGLAILDSITGRSQDCLANLSRAIELNPRNRLQARSDNDFLNMLDDPRFTELLYPELP
jgi:tetratricopeptide (TPR) repeat protein